MPPLEQELEENAGTTFTPLDAGPVLPSTLKELANVCLPTLSDHLALSYTPGVVLHQRGGPKVTYNDFRVVFLETLEEHGASGIHQFFFTSLQSLINRRASLPRSPASSS